MTVDRMTAEDYDEVFALWKDCPGLGLRSLDDSREGICAFLKRNPDTSFVARDGGKIVGAVLCGHDGRRGYIYHTVVGEEYRRKGCGTALVNSACDALRREGITRVCLNVAEGNGTGEAFWRGLGWEKKDFLVLYSKPISDKENLPLFRLP